MRKLLLIIHNVRSAHNVGAMLRTADGLGVGAVYLTGYSPYPTHKNDKRLPHIARKVTSEIQKTALGAVESVRWEYQEDIVQLFDQLQKDGYQLIGLEQHPLSKPLPSFKSSLKMAMIVGNEVDGIEPAILKRVDKIIEIPMKGKKESYNVAVAAGIALYHSLFIG